MTFATEKEKQASERFMLVRLEPARDLTPLFSSLGGGLYSASMPYKPTSVKRNGTALVSDNATPTVNDHYYWNGSSVVAKFAADPAIADIVTANYRVYLTGSTIRTAYSTPDDNLTEVVSWEPRLLEYPAFSQSVENILAGVFSISGLDINIVNADQGMNQYFTDNDSFYQKPCDIWLGIGAEVLRVYTGAIASCSVSDNVTLSVLDKLNVTNNTAFMGDTENECFINTTSHPNAMISDIGKTIPFILSRYSRREFSIDFATSSTSFFKPTKQESLNRAYCKNYNSSISSSNNREWILSRCRSIRKQSFGSIVRAFATGITRFRAAFYFSSYSNLYIGQPVRWNEGGTDYFGTISLIGDHLEGGLTYNVRVSCYLSPTVSTSSIFTSNYCLSVCARTTDLSTPATTVNSQFTEVLYEGKDYSVNEVSTFGGNKSISITLTSTMETFVNSNHYNFDGIFKFSTRAIDPVQDGIYYSFFTDGNLNHANAIADILDDVSLPYNSASITAAASYLPKNVHMQVGDVDGTSFPTYADVLNKILSSTLGFLTPISTGEIAYYLFKKPNPSTSANDDLIDESVFNGMSIDVQYQDIYSSVVAKNDLINIRWLGAEYGGGATGNIDAQKSLSLDDKKAKYLHGINKIYYIDYVLDDFTTAVSDILKVISDRKATYTFKTATKNLNHFIGKDLYIVSSKTLGILGNAKVKLLSNTVNGKEAQLACQDLLGLERT